METSSAAPSARVLVVDDVEDSRRILAITLGAAGFDVEEAESGGAALRVVPRVDVVVLDVRLPDIDGYEVCRRIKADPETSTVAVLLLSAFYQDNDHRARGLAVDADGHLSKPVAPEELIVAVKALAHAHQTESARHERERYFRALVENVQDMVSVLDADGRVLYASPSHETALGFRSEELVGRSALDLVHEEDRPVLARALRRGAASHAGARVQLRVRHRDGGWRVIEGIGRDLLDDPVVRGIVVSSRDVTDRRRAEDALVEREASFRLLFEDNPRPMWVFDRRTLAFLEVNRAASARYGYTRDEFLGMSITDIRPPEDVAAGLDPHRQEVAAGTRRPWRHRLKSGEVIEVEITLDELAYAGREAALMVVEDVAPRRPLVEELQHARKMEALGRLAGGVAHDFNNLLTVIHGRSQWALAVLERGHPVRRSLELIARAAARGSELTAQLLAFSRKQVLAPRRLDLDRVIDGMATMLRRLIGEDIDLVVVPSPAGAWIEADEGQMEQVLANLAVNARDAMPRGGRLVIETRAVTLDEEALGSTGPRPGRYVLLSIADSGSGMSEEVRARIFEPFFTTKEPGKGTGLGLPTVYGIVRQHGGDVLVDTEVDRGTEFRIYLPASAGVGAHADENREPPRPAGGREIVLLVEDDEEVRSVAADVLRDEGYEVIEAPDAAEGLLRARGRTGPIHLLVTDVVLPKMNGRMLAERLTTERPDMKVLYVSGYPTDSIVLHDVLEASAVLLHKPFTPDGLARAVHAVLSASAGDPNRAPLTR